jgi:hypothetical protein
VLVLTSTSREGTAKLIEHTPKLPPPRRVALGGATGFSTKGNSDGPDFADHTRCAPSGRDVGLRIQRPLGGSRSWACFCSWDTFLVASNETWIKSAPGGGTPARIVVNTRP